jgi:hypothetical protein
MTLIERYKKGETVKVYQEIHLLGEKAFEQPIFAEVEAVLIETFQRVKYNLEILHAALTEQNYQFKTIYECTSDYPIAKPLKNCDKLLARLDKTVQKFGYVPLSLKMFFKIVGSCNFSWDYDENPNIIWEYADPIQVSALNDMLALMQADDWKGLMKDLVYEGIDEDNCPYIEFSADYYHKDDWSGGQGYAIELTQRPSIDSRVLFEAHKTTFVNYLRLYFQKGGFIRIDNPDNVHDFAGYLESVLPKLLKI